MPKGKSDSKSSKGIPRKSRNPQRKIRRLKTMNRQPERKLRHLLKRNTVREAFDWASEHESLAVLRKLRPDYQAELREVGSK